jgi:hypothetical protein
MFDFIDEVYAEYPLSQKDNTWVKNIAKKRMSQPNALENCLADPQQKAKIANDIKNLSIDTIESTPSIGIYYDGKLV